MKKHLFSLLTLLFASSMLFAQETEAPQKDAKSEEYRRSSLCLILIDETDMPKRDTIVESFLAVPMPEKFNDHNISARVFNPEGWVITAEDKAAYELAVKSAAEPAGEGQPAPKKKGGGGFGKFMKAAAGTALSVASGSSKSVMVDVKDKEEYAIIAHKHLLEEKVAKQLFDKWFIDENGDFSIALVGERGLYDASTLDVQTAKNSVRGMHMLEDAGEELINNTFVVVSRFRYMSKDELMAEINATAQAAAGLLGGQAQAIAGLASMGASAALGAGYYVRSTSFLFQLKWNDEVANTFYSDLWDNHDKYSASDIFSLKYIGQESAFANVKAGIFTSKSEAELIRIATVNSTDAVLAKLQKKYEVFRTKTPLVVEGDKIYAYIGMKEGLEKGDKFEVLEQVMDPETGKTTYKRKATLTVNADKIWDNRFMANEELAEQGQEQVLTATEFTGNANGLYSGMLLRQIN